MAALKLSHALKYAGKMIMQGELHVSTITAQMQEITKPLHVSYITFVNRQFESITMVEPQNSIVLISATVGTTHLIDNIWI